MTDSTDEPPNGLAPTGDDVAADHSGAQPRRSARPPMAPARRRWLAGGIVLVVGVIGGAVLGLVHRSDDDDVGSLTSAADTEVSTGASAAVTTDAAIPTSLPADDEPTSTPAPSTVPPTGGTDAGAPDTDATTDTVDAVTTVSAADSDELQDYGTVATGQGVGAIRIPKIELSTFVVAGTGPDQLAGAVGHLSSTPSPGQLGNAVLVGLRASQLAPFKELDQLRIGDVVEIDTSPGGTYFYSVRSATVEEPTAVEVIRNTDDDQATLTLITCAPRGDTTQRLVVRASLVEELSSPAGAGEPNYGQPGDVPADSVEPCNMIPADVAATSTTTG